MRGDLPEERASCPVVFQSRALYGFCAKKRELFAGCRRIIRAARRRPAAAASPGCGDPCRLAGKDLLLLLLESAMMNYKRTQ